MRYKSVNKFIILLCILLYFLTLHIGLANADMSNRVYIGGGIWGFDLDVEGAIVLDICDIETSAGKCKLDSSIMVGDVIKAVGGKSIKKAEDISKFLNSNNISPVTVEFERDGKRIKEDIDPLIEHITGEKKLGVIVKDSITGLGTVTCVDKYGNFVALGHEIIDYDTGKTIMNMSGRLMKARINGIARGEKGKTGSIKGQILSVANGFVTSTGRFGLKGVMTGYSSDNLIELGNSGDVKPGAAKIYSAISGAYDFYDIKIIKCNNYSRNAEKNLVIKVVDEDLISVAGGIVQGMSGSPIVQNGKLIGAVTHVMVNDPTIGYGIYIENMF